MERKLQLVKRKIEKVQERTGTRVGQRRRQEMYLQVLGNNAMNTARAKEAEAKRGGKSRDSSRRDVASRQDDAGGHAGGGK